MNEELNNLIAILREELTQYGEVLALMQEQQELIINRAANELLINLNTVNSQMEQVAQVRQQRELARQQLVWQHSAQQRRISPQPAPGMWFLPASSSRLRQPCIA